MSDARPDIEDSDLYYQGTYWNDFEAVRRRINKRISGEPTLKWHEHFANSTRRKFRRALILNCGNGWVERELIEYGLISEAVGMDFSDALLAEADHAARALHLPLTYHQCDVNTDPFPPGEFDLVVNHAAAHHIAAIDRVFRQICRVLTDDGWFVSFDYVGPHRNQYGLAAWEEAWRVNSLLPVSLRQQMEYPPMPVMLVVDPSEAVHSELIIRTFERYFTPHQLTPLGGAIAYPLITHNKRLFESGNESERERCIEEILDADDRFLAEHPESTLFAYFAGTPKKDILENDDDLARWEAGEAFREREAERRGGEYYPRTPLSKTLVALDEQRAHNAAVHARAEELEAELRAMRSRVLYASARRALDSRLMRAIRRQAMVVRLERRARRFASRSRRASGSTTSV